MIEPFHSLPPTFAYFSSVSPYHLKRADIHIVQSRIRIRRRVGNFNYKSSQAWTQLSIADLIADAIQIRPDRDGRRRKIAMIKWLDDNWALIHPLLCSVVFEH
jgi:hypothetical protein